MVNSLVVEVSILEEGLKVEPWLIDRIENAKGEIIYAADPVVACPECLHASGSAVEGLMCAPLCRCRSA